MKNTGIIRGVPMAFAIVAGFVLAPLTSSAQDDGTSYFGKQNGYGPSTLGPAPAGSPTPAPPQTEEQRGAAEISKTYHASLDFISGKEAAGNGFIVTMGGTNYLVTNARLTITLNDAAFKGLDGTAVKGTPSVAVGENIFRMEAPAGGKPFEVMQGVNQNAGIGDAVVVLGSAGAGGVINPIIGKITGVGPNLVEVDAPFDATIDGSPIIHLKSGKVIGVASYAVVKSYEAGADGKTNAPVIHRYASVLDSVKTWQPVNWQSYYAQAVMMQNIHTVTDDLYDFFSDLSDNGHITPDRHKNSALKSQIDRWVGDKNPLQTGPDTENVTAKYISYLKTACASDVNNAQRYTTYDYFQRELGNELQARAELAKAFDQMLKGAQGSGAPAGFAGTVWETAHAEGSRDYSRITFEEDGRWVENWRGITHRGHWKATDDSKVVEIQLVNGDNVNGHGVIHYKMSDDGKTCFRIEEAVTWVKKTSPL